MTLSERALKFLQKQEFKKESIKTIDEIELAFSKAGKTLTDPVKDFQLKYGGLQLYHGLEPICFSLLHSKTRGNFVGHENKLLVREPCDEIPLYFDIADTLLQEDFGIDLDGNYYMAYEKQASCFEIVIEDHSIYQEKDPSYKAVHEVCFEEHNYNYQNIISTFNLKDYLDFPQDIIHWGYNSNYIFRLSKNFVTVYGQKDFPAEAQSELNKLLGL